MVDYTSLRYLGYFRALKETADLLDGLCLVNLVLSLSLVFV